MLDEVAKHLLPPQNELIEEEIEMIDYIFGRLKEVAKAVNLVKMSLPKMELKHQSTYQQEMILLCGF